MVMGDGCSLQTLISNLYTTIEISRAYRFGGVGIEHTLPDLCVEKKVGTIPQ